MSAIGLIEIYRLDPVLARDQSVWIIVGLLGFAGLIFVLRDHRRLENYKYTLAATAVLLLVITMIAGTTVNGAKLWLRFGGVQVQPGEFAKLLLVIFLAGYLREKREVLTFAHRRILGIGVPAMKHFGPLLLMTGLALIVVAVMNDLGTALLLFGIFLAMLYVATGRHAYTVVGLGLFLAGSWFVYHNIGHVHERFQIWLNPWDTPQTTGYQIVQSIEAIADGGVFGTGLGKSLQLVGSPPHPIIPAAQTDGIYAVWADEAGLAGRRRPAAGLPAVRLSRLQDRDAGAGRVLDAAGGRAHVRLLAAGLPDRGRGHPAGAADRHHAAVRELRRLLDRLQLPAAGAAFDGLQPHHPGSAMNHQITNLFRLCAIGFAVLISFTAYWQIWAADSLAMRQDNARLVYRQLQIKRGLIFAANGHTVLARNHKSTHDGQTIYTRRYPFGGLFAQVVGYNTVDHGRTGIELSYNDFLTSSNANLATVVSQTGRPLAGRDGHRRQRRHEPLGAGAASGSGRHGRQGRRGRGDRAGDRPGAGDVLVAELHARGGRPNFPKLEDGPARRF